MKYKVDNVKNYSRTKGWICGQFFPEGSILKNNELEVKYNELKPGDFYPEHLHPKGKEVVVIIKGKVKWLLDGKEFILQERDFIFLENNVKEAVVEVLEPTITVSVRTPSIPNNKILV